MDSGNIKKPTMTSIKTRPLERNIALTKLGLGAGTKIVAHSLVNIFRGEVARSSADREFYEKQAQVLADELGRLKGSVMKAGQMLSLYGQYFLPEEAVEVLSGLQDDTAPVAWRVVAPVLEKNLGRQRLAELEIDEEPLAAASLGQAHRAVRRSDGLELVVKIQYPGVADAIDSDIKTLSRLLMVTRLSPKGLDLAPVFAEVREMLYREVDYRAEARFTEEFGRRLADDPRYGVPRVLSDYSSGQVLTTTYESGVSARDAEIRALPQARRNRLGLNFLDLFLTEFFDWGLVQSDPHFGNYRIRLGDKAEEDRIVLLDFGATRRFERRFVDAYKGIVRGALLADRAQILRGADAIGLMRGTFPEPVLKAFTEMCQLIVEPFNAADDSRTPPQLRNAQGEYRWGASDLPMRAANVAARNALSVHFRVPPREIVFLHRRLAGVFIMLATLDVELDARERLLERLGLEDLLGG
ncbi:MAG: AarF/ABC1/UbiB kinase family protein [Nevskia sp.]|nr:AarF/ABC1/UbiB kinase family protein [Nevskia sp.]